MWHGVRCNEFSPLSYKIIECLVEYMVENLFFRTHFPLMRIHIMAPCLHLINASWAEMICETKNSSQYHGSKQWCPKPNDIMKPWEVWMKDGHTWGTNLLQPARPVDGWIPPVWPCYESYVHMCLKCMMSLTRVRKCGADVRSSQRMNRNNSMAKMTMLNFWNAQHLHHPSTNSRGHCNNDELQYCGCMC